MVRITIRGVPLGREVRVGMYGVALLSPHGRVRPVIRIRMGVAFLLSSVSSASGPRRLDYGDPV